MVFWLFLKVLFLYGISFLFSVSIYFYLNRRLLPPHRALEFPLIWREGEIAIVELEKGQRLGGNFYLKPPQQGDAGSSGTRPVIQSNVPYDICLLLKYPDRPEIADLGNLRVSLKIFRKDGREAGKFEIVKALRYESKILRFSKEILSLPVSLWKDSGSERIERISLVKRLIDGMSQHQSQSQRENEFGLKEENKKNPIERLEISINPLPPLHSVDLQILANLSPIQNFLFYWKIPAAILIIGGCTSILWLIVSFFALIEVIKLLLRLKRGEAREAEEAREEDIIDLSEIEEFKQVITESDTTRDIACDSACDISDDISRDIVVSVQFPQAESVANFIGDLRQRKIKTTNNDDGDGDDDDDVISIYNSDTEDQSVPSSN